MNASRLDTQKEPMNPFESKIRRKIKAVRQEESSLTCQRVDPFVLFRPSNDWMGPTTLGKAICIIQSTNSKVNLIMKYPYRHTQNNV